MEDMENSVDRVTTCENSSDRYFGTNSNKTNQNLCIFAYDEVITKLRAFFKGQKGFVEVPAQSRKSILAACEDPKTIATFNFSGEIWPLPQTGQMWLEYELLKHSHLNGVFCITTNYRDEPKPIEGRHDKVFPMFEFESRGDVKDLENLEKDLLRFLGFGFGENDFASMSYEELCNKYGTKVLEAGHETQMNNDYGSVLFLKNFPQRTHPFWNMKHKGDNLFSKIDVILHGMETIGSAERSSNVEEMRENFLTISEGNYAKLLFGRFGRERVMKELDAYLSLPMFPRFGAGIGITRMARAMKLGGILKSAQSDAYSALKSL